MSERGGRVSNPRPKREKRNVKLDEVYRRSIQSAHRELEASEVAITRAYERRERAEARLAQAKEKIRDAIERERARVARAEEISALLEKEGAVS